MFYAIQILILGGLAGWLASVIMGYRKQNILNALLLGVLGSIVGSYIFDFMDIAPRRLVGTFVMTLVGSCAVLWLMQWFKERF